MATNEESYAALVQPLDLDEGDAKRLAVALGAKTPAEAVERLTTLEGVALREVVHWLVSKRRFGTISELDSARVLALFLEIRGEYPTVDQLVDELGISSSRAVSLLGRLKYGEGKALGQLARKAAVEDIERKLAEQSVDDGNRKALLLSKSAFEEVEASNYAIMSEPLLHQKDGRFARAESADLSPQGKYGGTVRASVTMWGYMLDVIKGKLY